LFRGMGLALLAREGPIDKFMPMQSLLVVHSCSQTFVLSMSSFLYWFYAAVCTAKYFCENTVIYMLIKTLDY